VAGKPSKQTYKLLIAEINFSKIDKKSIFAAGKL
jgi:hypothetical protein